MYNLKTTSLAKMMVMVFVIISSLPLNLLYWKKNKFFADIHFNYTLKSAFLSLGYTNILNTDEYIYSSFDGINSYYNNYKIRPACLLFKIKFKLI